MKTKNSTEKYLNFLFAISQRKRGFRDIRKIIAKFRISMSVQKILSDKLFVVKDDNGIWKWTGRTPELKMAEQIKSEVNSYVNKTSSKVKEAELIKEDKKMDLLFPKYKEQKKESKKEKEPNKTEEKYLNFLIAFHQRERGVRNLDKFFRKFKISNAIRIALQEKNLLKQNPNGTWIYTGAKPDSLLAGEILHGVNQTIHKHKHAAKTDSSHPKKTRENKKALSTEDKYLKILQEISQRKRGEKSLHKMFDKFKVSRAISTVVHHKNLVEKKNGVWKWIGGEPDSLMAGMVLYEVNRSIQASAAKSITKKKSLGEHKPKSLKKLFKSQGLNVDKVIVHKYVPASNGNGNGKDVLDLSELRKERTALQNGISKINSRISKINSILEVVDAFQENN